MTLHLVTAPAADVVSVGDVKAHLRVDGDDEDAVIADMIGQATAEIDGRDGLLGRALMTQTWRLLLPGWPDAGPGFRRTAVGQSATFPIRLPLPPLLTVEAITYLDGEGVEQAMSLAGFRVLGDVEPGEIWPAVGGYWPSVPSMASPSRNPIAITYKAGYGDAGDAVPAPIRQWIKNRVGLLYAYRESPPPPKLGGLVNLRPAMVA